MKNIFSHTFADLKSGLVVFLVAIPLCLGIALGSGVPAFSGIIAGVVGGIVVGAISNSRVGVSGPAAGLIAIILGAMMTFKAGFDPNEFTDAQISLMALQMLAFSVLIAGVIQVILGFAKAGFIAYYFPNVVIKGMLAAIGLILIKKQLTHGLGYDKDALGDYYNTGGGVSFFQEIWAIISDPSLMSVTIICITLFSLAILILWERPFIKNSVLGNVPGAVIVVVLGIVYTYLTQGNAELSISAEHRVKLGVQGKEVGDLFAFPLFSQFANPQVWITGVTIAIVASIETLLCVEATDKLDPEKHITDPNRELIAQGSGNLVAGFLGGLPITQVIVRSSANINSGVKTKMAAIYHGLFIVVCVAAIPFVLNMVPFASLSAILFMVGYKLAKPALFKQIFKRGWADFIPFVVTIGAILATDLLKGIGIGLAVSIFFVLYNNYKASHYLEETIENERLNYIIHLTENMTFLNKASLNATLDSLKRDSFVVIDKRRVIHLSNDIIDLLNEFYARAEQENIHVEVVGKGDITEKIINAVPGGQIASL